MAPYNPKEEVIRFFTFYIDTVTEIKNDRPHIVKVTHVQIYLQEKSLFRFFKRCKGYKRIEYILRGEWDRNRIQKEIDKHLSLS